MSLVCGADGYRTGWVAIMEGLETGALIWQVAPSIEILATELPPLDMIAVDVPIGLPDAGQRACDVAARQLLGEPQRRSGFPTPIRPVLDETSYQAASAAWYRVEGKRMQQQAWGIVPKIAKVDRLLRNAPHVRPRVREVHPEVCFYYLAGGRPMAHAKKTSSGRSERIDLLMAAFGDVVQEALEDRRLRGCAADDILDGFVALWTARRVHEGKAMILPSSPPRDRHGLPMEMVA